MRLTIFLFYAMSALSQTHACDSITRTTLWTGCVPETRLVVPPLEGKTVSLIDFGLQTVCSITKPEKQGLLAEGFQEIKSHFDRSGFSIYVSIRRKEFKFKADFSFKGTFSMAPNLDVPFLKERHETIEQETVQHIFNDRWITVNGLHYGSSITITENDKLNRVGLGFLQGFDWIVDWREKKVFLRKNSMPIERQSVFPKTYRPRIQGERLVIGAKNSKELKFDVGDEILSVNGVKITPENLCDMAARLSNSSDWNLLDIEAVNRKLKR